MSKLGQWLGVFYLIIVSGKTQALLLYEYEDLVIEVKRIELYQYDGTKTEVDLPEPLPVSIKALNSDVFMDIVDFDPGLYHRMNLIVNAQRRTVDSFVTVGEQHRSLYVANQMIKLKGPFLVNNNGEINFTVDLDKAIYKPSGSYSDYKIKPEIKIIDFNE